MLNRIDPARDDRGAFPKGWNAIFIVVCILWIEANTDTSPNAAVSWQDRQMYGQELDIAAGERYELLGDLDPQYKTR